MLKKQYYKTKGEYDVTFVYSGEGDRVALLIDANDWEPVKMTKNQGVYKKKLRLPAEQRYQFRYLVDDANWANDDAADDYVPNEHGSTNSVVDLHTS